MSVKIETLGNPKIELINGIYVNWNKKKIVKNGLAKGTYYPTYYDAECKQFFFWQTRKELKIKGD
ncbi:MAG: hypothetical protein WC389_20445 [Lutibacter sp.]|jgi:hypothetical protein